MQINKISNITFKENNFSRDIDSQNAILMLRDPNASIKFQQNQEIAQNADIMNTNPIKAIGYKFYRTFSMIKDSESQENQEKHFNRLA